MTELTFDCELVAPTFLGGADNRKNPELRAPSIRGAMRYWYRALCGGINSNTATVKTQEDQLFGSTEQASSVSILVQTDRPFTPVPLNKKDNPIRTSKGDFLPSGRDYLFWSLFASGGKPGSPRYQSERDFIPPGTHFTIRLRSYNDAELYRACAALWLLANLGAIGGRARRGAGAFLANLVKGQTKNLIFEASQSGVNLAQDLGNGIRLCRDAVGVNLTWQEFGESLTEFDTLSPSSARIWVVTEQEHGWGSHQEALNSLGGKLRDYRSHINTLGRADHDAVLNWMGEGGPGPKIRRTAFGLPIPFGYSGGGPRDVIQGEGVERRASPLHIRLTRLRTGRFVGVLVLFKSQFLDPKKNHLQLQTRKWKAPAPEEYSVIEEFIASFPKHWSVNYD